MVVPRPPKSYVRVQFLPLLTQYILARFKKKKKLKRNWFMGRTPFLHNGERSSSLLFLNFFSRLGLLGQAAKKLFFFCSLREQKKN